MRSKRIRWRRQASRQRSGGTQMSRWLLLLLFAGNAKKLTNMGLGMSLAGECELAATNEKAKVGTA